MLKIISTFFKSSNAREKFILERLTVPLHITIIAFFIFLFGSYRLKVRFDLILREPYAFGVLRAADYAKSFGLKKIKVIEFGIGEGHGLLKLQEISRKVTMLTNVEIEIFAFDIIEGMPSTKDFRDSPDAFEEGSYKTNLDELQKKLYKNVNIVVGDVTETIEPWMKKNLSSESPIGFISFDLDMYYGTKAALKVLNGNANCYLPYFWVYFDDIRTPATSDKIGELLAIREFNYENSKRSITEYPFLASERIFKNSAWLRQMRILNVYDHPRRT